MRQTSSDPAFSSVLWAFTLTPRRANGDGRPRCRA